jgi:hypothetical protein
MSTDRKVRKAVLATFVGGALIFGGGTAAAQYDDYDGYDDYDDYDGYDSEDPAGPGTDPGTSPGTEAPVSTTGSLPRTGGPGTLLLAGGALAAGAAATRRFLLNR